MKKINSDNVFTLLVGASISVYGALAYFRQEYDSSRFGHMNLGEHHQLIGILLLLAGSVVCWTVLKRE